MGKFLYQVTDAIGYAFLTGTPGYCAIVGDGNWDIATSNAQAQFKVYGNYVWSGASIYVKANPTTATSYLHSMVNGVAGNQVVEIAAGATGLFQDLVHNDSLVNGDKINWVFVRGSVAAISITFAACALDGTAIQGSNVVSIGNDYRGIGGGGLYSTTEADVVYTMRQSGTFSNLRLYVSANTRNGACTMTLRKNGADTALVVTVPATTTGEFEDTTHSVSVVDGDTVCLYGPRGGTTGSITCKLVQMDFSGNRILIGGQLPGNVLYGNQRQPLEGWTISSNTTEARAQSPALGTLTLQNLSLRVATNTRNGDTTFVIRKGGVSDALTITIPAATTGLFEDTANTVSVVATDLINYGWTPGGSSGELKIYMMAVEEAQPSGADTPVSSAVTMGLAGSVVRAATVSRTAALSLGTALTVTRAWGRTRDAAVSFGLATAVTRAIEVTRSAANQLGGALSVAISASGAVTHTAIDAAVSFGMAVSNTRSVVVARAASTTLGLVAGATRVRNVTQNAAVSLGRTLTVGVVRNVTRTASVLWGWRPLNLISPYINRRKTHVGTNRDVEKY